MTYSYNPDPTTTTTTEETGSNLSKLENQLKRIRDSGNNILSTYNDGEKYNFIIGYNEGSLDVVSESVNSNSNLTLKYTLTHIKMLIVNGQAKNFLSLLRQRSNDIEFIQIDSPDTSFEDDKLQYKDKNYVIGDTWLPTNENNKSDLVINRGIVDTINRGSTDTGSVEPTRDFEEEIACGQHLQKATIKTKGITKGADIIITEVYSGLVENVIAYKPPENGTAPSFDPAGSNGLPLVTYYDWWDHVAQLDNYRPVTWQNNKDSKGNPVTHPGKNLHATNAVAFAGAKNMGFAEGRNIYVIGMNAVPDSALSTGCDTQACVMINCAIGFHKSKLQSYASRGEKAPGTIVNCSWSTGGTGIPKDPYWLADLFGSSGGENKCVICYTVNGQRKTKEIYGTDNAAEKEATYDFLRQLGINPETYLAADAYINNDFVLTPGTSGVDFSVNRAVRDGLKEGIQFVCSGGNEFSGFFNSSDERSKTFYLYDASYIDIPNAQKFYPSIRYSPYIENDDDVKEGAHKQIIVGGLDIKNRWDNNDESRFNAFISKGNCGTHMDIKAAFTQDSFDDYQGKEIFRSSGTSWSAPLTSGLLASLTYSASAGQIKKQLGKCTKVINQNLWDLDAKTNKLEVNDGIYKDKAVRVRNCLMVPKKRIKKYKLNTNWVNKGKYCAPDEQLYPVKKGRIDLDETNNNLSPLDTFDREQIQFNGYDRKRHGNLMRLNNRRGFND